MRAGLFISTFLFVVGVFFAGYVDFGHAAVSVGDPNTSAGDTSNTSAGSPSNTSAGGCPPGQLCNPLQSQTIPEFLLKIIDVLLVFALPFIILYIMYAGFLFVTAQGDSGQIQTARTALLWAVVGGVIVLGARIIIGVIQGTIQAF